MGYDDGNNGTVEYDGYILAYNGGEIIDWKTKELMYKMPAI